MDAKYNAGDEPYSVLIKDQNFVFQPCQLKIQMPYSVLIKDQNQ